ncbi:alpha/beta fold hydrolase [Nonomuraea turkmeniaca]|uniref:Alpha/beta fold hydrolase n=1 Tax=Nonomuraea turkmeniaca TaxID=103838 RepID=A0A5S4FVI6_9ACTN|nr:alpha/beta fold hydrolase [Nonomuraea turkmeniaca]TMR24786.1 alpha/beta fold hydrolase [Nonomuraea turkmeniaca]
MSRAVRRFEPRPRASTRLFCFPHAGGAASGYRAWVPLLPQDVELVALQYPGREDRLADPLESTMAGLVAQLADAVEPLLDRPYTFFGHSMGAAVAYEVALELRRRHAPRPVRLFASGHEGPGRARGGTVHLSDDASLAAELARLGGSGSHLLDDPELRALMLPIIRNDYRLIETYRPATAPPLDCPITALRGTSDHDVTDADARAWAEVTTAGCEALALPGGHFYLLPERERLVRAVVARLHPDHQRSPMTTTEANPFTEDFRDDYMYVAEIYDLLSGSHWEQIRHHLVGALADVDPSYGPVVDLGAGTGQATHVVGATLPDARIIATEPSSAMRIALINKLANNPDLKRRVTVLPSLAQHAELPDRISAVTAFGMMGYLTEADRKELFRKLAERMPPGAPIVMELMALSSPQEMVPARIAREQLGEHTYEVWMRGEPGGPGTMRYASSFTVTRAGKVVKRMYVEQEWFTFGIEELEAESGMRGHKLTNEIIVLTR